MGKLMKKELKLALHPTAFIFLALSMMLMIPNYPYYVIFFYTSLAVFFTCLTGRENHDIFYTMLLPVKKSDIVKSRFTTVILLELVQMVVAIPFAVIRQHFQVPHNQVGMEANIALFGSAFIMLGIFHVIFFGIYYKHVDQVGKAFGLGSIGTAIYIGLAETLTHAVPFFRDCLDTFDNQYVGYKLVVLVVGIVIYGLLTGLAYGRAVKDFEKQDL